MQTNSDILQVATVGNVLRVYINTYLHEIKVEFKKV